MVGIVVVSHSGSLAAGVVELARQMASAELRLEAAGGIEEAGVLGTDADRVRRAIERAMSADGVLVLMDLGSALMSAEFAVELLEDASGPVRLSAAPLVEGAVAAAVAASGGATLDEVAAQARGALAMKTAQIHDEPANTGEPEDAAEETPANATAELPVLAAVGLHARPAARFVETARGFDADVRVSKVGTSGLPVKAASLTNLIALGARLGDSLRVSASGPQAAAAVAALRELAASGFGDGVAQSSPPQGAPAGAPEQNTRVVPATAPAAGTVLTGIPASAGLTDGPAYRLGGSQAPPPERTAEDPAAERGRLEGALTEARAGIERDRELVARRAGQATAEIFNAHLALLDDEALLAPAQELISGGATAESAWYEAAQEVAAVYVSLEDPLLRERATDVLDVGRRVVALLIGAASGLEGEHGILVADELTPTDTVGLDPKRVLGIAAARGSNTAHAAILARSIGLPAVLGLGPEILAVADGTALLLNGRGGTVTVKPSPALVRAAETQRRADERRAAAALTRAHELAYTRDGSRVEVFANIGAAADTARAVELGAEGVGMLRTEFLFMERDQLPDEEEQTETLREIARTLNGRPLVVRTLDAGADKPLRALPMPAERNPFLGMRGIRLTLLRSELLATQFRAVLRAAVDHPVKVMMPMVATLAEVLAAKQVLAQAREQTGIDAPVELGVTVEVPAAALGAARLAPHVDFFSLGTNDLTQYTMAAERGDARLAALLTNPQPAVLRLIRETVMGGTQHGCWVGVCGEMAGDPAAAVLLAGLGVTELSMSAALIPELKETLRQVDLEDACRAAEAALDADSADAARALAETLLA